MQIVGLIAVVAFILAQVALAAALGRHEHGSFKAWWRS